MASTFYTCSNHSHSKVLDLLPRKAVQSTVNEDGRLGVVIYYRVDIPVLQLGGTTQRADEGILTAPKLKLLMCF